MRRSAAAVALTVIGLWLILTFKSSPVSHASSRPAPAALACLPSRSVKGGNLAISPPFLLHRSFVSLLCSHVERDGHLFFSLSLSQWFAVHGVLDLTTLTILEH